MGASLKKRPSGINVFLAAGRSVSQWGWLSEDMQSSRFVLFSEPSNGSDIQRVQTGFQAVVMTFEFSLRSSRCKWLIIKGLGRGRESNP
jgi:hypothetical protein